MESRYEPIVPTTSRELIAGPSENLVIPITWRLPSRERYREFKCREKV